MPASPLADIHYEEEREVDRVLIRIEYSDGTTHEYEAREPQDWELAERMTTRRTGVSIGGGDTGFVSHAVPALRLTFTAHPRHNLHISTHGPWQMLSVEAKTALSDFLAAMGYEAQ